ncbi:hypothetical protein PR202_gb24985 [Eleusine coracana subsp. coracana]|uniref:UBA domain-containing protein n=1 Tax=Eleusine coracana subsp. coracana TaxID=191504 RepID=A0AAV5FMD3_ELECO|nr:hypothetical protein PR202_gb24985 [Eleusine coracana subsp. coracana]
MQVKIEDQAEYSGMNADAESLRDAAWDPPPTRVKEEVTCSLTISSCRDGQPSSSSCNLRLQFIAMGFSEKLVDKVLQQHGDDDSDTILGYLLSYPALQKSGSESSYSLGSLFDSDNEENISLLEPRNQDIKPDPDSFLEKRSYLLRTMNFSQQEVDFTLNELGEKAPLEQLVDHIINSQSEGSSRQNENDDATSEGKVQSLFSVMDRSVGLLHMGFTEEEVSWAIGNFGQEATITDLADHIFARRIANSIEQKEVKVESDFLDETETEFSTYRTSCFGVNYEDDDGYGRDHTRVKRAKTIFVDDREASSSHSNNPRFMGRCSRTNGLVKEEPEAITPDGGGKTEQKGELRQYPGIGTINTTKIENLIAEFGGFDLIIGGNYNSYRGGTTINATMGLDAQHFYEYARVVKSFRSAVGLH